MTQTTYIIRNLSDDMLANIATMAPRDLLAKLERWAWGDLRHCVTVKYGSGAFGDRVTWNSIVKSEKPLKFKIEPRKGYKLVTFEAID